MIHLGLVGYPLEHSYSPKIHQAALRACNLRGEYSLFTVTPNDAQGRQSLLRELRSGGIAGLNVTIPYKQNMIPWLDELTPEAQAIGAVNTIYRRDGKLIGTNTDAPGFLEDLKKFIKVSIPVGSGPEKYALVLGAGGSARAVTHALLKDGWNVTIAARRPEQARGLIDHFRAPGLQLSVIEYQATPLEAILSSLSLIVNTTPVGMFPNEGESPWPDGLSFPENAGVYDLVYNPRETLLVKQARGAGLRARNGLGMLVEQAALSFEIWTGQAAPRAAMFASLEEECCGS